MNFLITGRYRAKKNKRIFYLVDGWNEFLKKFKSKYKLHNPKTSIASAKKFDCLIISGGGDIYNISKNNHDRYRDKVELRLIKLYIKLNKPIILVCRGFQLLADYHKNKLIKMNGHVKTHHSLKIKKNLFLSGKNINTNSYHNYGFLKLNNVFEVIGRSTDKSIEIATLKNKKVLCTMFHPERYNKSQKRVNELILSFLEISSCN